MRRALRAVAAAVGFLLLVLLASAPSASAASGPGWNPGASLVFSDEFTNHGLDTSKWTPGWFGTGVTGPINRSELARYDSGNVAQPGDGYLHLHLWKDGKNGQPYTGSVVSSNGHFDFAYGDIEFRAYIPPTADWQREANWPALWTDGQNWPADGENDVFEALGGRPAYHFHSPAGGPGATVPWKMVGWHRFGAHWEPGKVTYYYDGHDVGQITTGITGSPQYLIMNNTIGPNSMTVPWHTDLRIDWVRVWQ